VRTLLTVAVSCALLAGQATARAQDADPWFGQDKAYHFDVSAGIAAATYGVSAAYLVDARWKALAIAGGTTLVLGAAKEAVDATHVFGGDPSWKDFTWDAIGMVAGLVLAFGVDVLLGGVSLERPLLASP
jgi:putative lipoprotein